MSISGVSSNLAIRTSNAPPPEAAVGCDAVLRDLQARAQAGTLTPVQSGQLARLQGDHGGATTHETRHAAAVASGGTKTVADFKLIGATAQDRADFKQALEYLQQKGADGKPLSPTAAKLLQQLPKGTKIEIIHDGNDAYSPSSDTIYWDPRSGLKTPNGTQSAALGLIHEMDHKANGLANPKPTGDAYDNTEEKRVVTGSETRIAHELGEPTRTDHRGEPVTLRSSTAHTAVKAEAQARTPDSTTARDPARPLYS